jgi:hypothetical protein
LTEELASLTELLKLPLSCCLAVHQVLKEGNWAKADSPRAYIKKAAMTQARKMHLAIPLKDVFGQDTLGDDTLECGGGPLVFMGGAELDQRCNGYELAPVGEVDKEDTGRGVRIPKTPLKGKHYVKAQFAPDDEVLAREVEAAESRPFLPSDCLIEWALYVKRPDGSLASVGSERRCDWKKLGEKAGLDLWEIKVLEFRDREISRDSAMELQPDEVSRKAIQAAWKRVDRTRMNRLRDYLKKNSLKDVPEQHSEDTRKVEASVPPHPKAALPGNPLQADWKRTGGTSREDLGKFLVKSRGRTPHLWGSGVKILDPECPE